MKRDWDLIRKILLEIERKESAKFENITIQEFEFGKIAEHVAILKEAGLIEAETPRSASGTFKLAIVSRLTWEGHEFMELSRNDSFWNKAIKQMKDKALPATISVITEVIKEIIKNSIT